MTYRITRQFRRNGKDTLVDLIFTGFVSDAGHYQLIIQYTPSLTSGHFVNAVSEEGVFVVKPYTLSCDLFYTDDPEKASIMATIKCHSSRTFRQPIFDIKLIPQEK